uniref:Uncharacterized protein n=1 Tax=Bicosoecida sp. CB-2014 TaxID=1486930 RepID=A0A7S1CE52_9STRA
MEAAARLEELQARLASAGTVASTLQHTITSAQSRVDGLVAHLRDKREELERVRGMSAVERHAQTQRALEAAQMDVATQPRARLKQLGSVRELLDLS